MARHGDSHTGSFLLAPASQQSWKVPCPQRRCHYLSSFFHSFFTLLSLPALDFRAAAIVASQPASP